MSMPKKEKMTDIPLCKDCRHHYAENGRRICSRPVPNLMVGGTKRLVADCEAERGGLSAYPEQKTCGMKGVFFEQRFDVR